MPGRTAALEQQQLCLGSSDQSSTDTQHRLTVGKNQALDRVHTAHRTPGQAGEELCAFQLLRAASGFISFLTFAGCCTEVTVSVT